MAVVHECVPDGGCFAQESDVKASWGREGNVPGYKAMLAHALVDYIMVGAFSALRPSSI